MSSLPRSLSAAALLCALAAQAQPSQTEAIGRAALPSEIAAWDIDVRPDFKGLPKGSGSVAMGLHVWDEKCSSCHGVFGEDNQVSGPIAGGVSSTDVLTGRVASLSDAAFGTRTSLMKLATLSTLWDYINRAMPWTAPKSLTTDEVYAVTAFVLNLGGVLPDDFTLSDRNMVQVQQSLPNRHGLTTEHAMWPGAAFGARAADVSASACMRNCAPSIAAARLTTRPDRARNSHGNLAEQNRLVGAQRGADTRPPANTAAGAAGADIPERVGE